MTINRNQFPLLLEPKLSNIWNEAYPNYPVEWPQMFNTRTSQKAQTTDYKMTDFGTLRYKAEGEDVSYDEPINGPTKVYTPVTYGLGYKVTAEMRRHELYGQIDRLENALLKSAVDNQETLAALILNNGFSATAPAGSDGYSATGFDGLALFSTAHTRLDGGATQGNRPSADVDFGLTAVQNMVIAFHTLKDDRGRPQQIRPRLLIIHPNDIMTAREIINSELKPGTANNDINALREDNLSFMVSHYLTDGDAWFARADVHDASFVWDLRPETSMDTDFDSEDLKRKVLQAAATGFGEWRGWYGSPGA